jgi:hypothetical protein
VCFLVLGLGSLLRLWCSTVWLQQSRCCFCWFTRAASTSTSVALFFFSFRLGFLSFEGIYKRARDQGNGVWLYLCNNFYSKSSINNLCYENTLFYWWRKLKVLICIILGDETGRLIITSFENHINYYYYYIERNCFNNFLR